MKLLSVRTLWRHASRSCSRLSNLELSDWEVNYVDTQTKYILDHAYLEKSSKEVLSEYFNQSTKNIHPALYKRRGGTGGYKGCPLKLERMLKAIDTCGFDPDTFPIQEFKYHQPGLLSSFRAISELENRPLTVKVSNDDTIEMAIFERWRDKTVTILEKCNFIEDAEHVKQVACSGPTLRGQLCRSFFPATGITGSIPYYFNPVDMARLKYLRQKCVVTLPSSQQSFLMPLDLLVQMRVCNEILGDEGLAMFHTPDTVPLPIKLHFLRSLGLNESLCHEALKIRLPIWRSKTLKSPQSILGRLKTIFDVHQSHELTLECLKSPSLKKVPKTVLQSAIEEIHENYDHTLSVDTKTELLLYIVDKAHKFNDDVALMQLNETSEHNYVNEEEQQKDGDSFYNYMVPAQYFEDNKFSSVEKSSSKYWNSAHILHARNLSTCGQNRRCFSTSIPRTNNSRPRKLVINFEEPNFTRWCKTKLDTFFLRIGLDYQFDRKEFLRGCEMVNRF